MSAGEAEILEMAGEIDEEVQRVLYEQAKASQEREKSEEMDRGVQQVLYGETYPEEGVNPVSDDRPDRR
ncbi:MAG: hypothetical protein OXF02_02315 [Simkaniaceae bacterium]|nr:hypothetical protein [Simkaniaceae bacterium]